MEKRVDIDEASDAAGGALPSRLPSLAVVGIGSGDFGLNLYWQTASLYLLYVYTDVLHVPTATAGLIYMAALVWDAALDPLIGALADRTRTRFGRYRPYLVLGGLPLAVSFVCMFLPPVYPARTAILLVAVTHVIFRTCYGVVSVPYSALGARVTRQGHERTRLSVARMVFSTTGAVLVAVTALPLAQLAAPRARPEVGWMAVGVAYAAIATAMLLMAARAARGLDRPTVSDPVSPPLGLKLRAVRANGPMMIVLGATVIMSFSSTIFQKGLIYYFKYVVGDARLGSLAIGFLAIIAAVSVPVWGKVARTFGKRAAWLWGLVPYIVGIVLWRWADGRGTVALFAALAAVAVGTGANVVCFWAMIPDTVEFAEWRTGVRAESLVFGLVLFGQKVALGCGAGLLGLWLARIGYVADVAQTPHTLAQLKSIIFFAPLMGALMTAALISFYPLTPERHGRLVAEIAARQTAQ